MKILFVGDTRGSSGALHYYTNFIRLGHTVFPFDPQYFATDSLAESVATRLRGGPSEKRRTRISHQLTNLCHRNAFDMVFVMSELFLGSQTLEEIRSVSPNRPCLVFHSHDNVFSPGICKPSDFQRTLATYDLVFTTKSQNVARYQAFGQSNAFFTPSAYEPTVHRPIGPQESTIRKTIPISFIGTFDQSRIPYLEVLKGEDLHVWGDRWQKYRGHDVASSRIHRKPIYYFEFADVLSHSEISLGLLRAEAGDLHTQRTFEIPACGTLQIAPRNDEIQEFFEDGKEIVLFSSPEELKDKTRYYREHSTERRAIARRGWERLHKDPHTYQDRCEEFLRLAGHTKSFLVAVK